MWIAIVWMHDIFNVAIAIEIMLRKSNLNSLWSPLEYFTTLANIYHRMLRQLCSRSNWLIKVCNEYWFALKWFAVPLLARRLNDIFSFILMIANVTFSNAYDHIERIARDYAIARHFQCIQNDRKMKKKCLADKNDMCRQCASFCPQCSYMVYKFYCCDFDIILVSGWWKWQCQLAKQVWKIENSN